jgi:hypothetical protein
MIFHFPWYYPAVATLVAAALSFYTWSIVRARHARWEVVHISIITVLVWILVVPGTFVDELEITTAGARTTRAMPLTISRELQFSTLYSIERESEINRWGIKQEVWIVAYKDGRREKFDLGDLWRTYANEIAAGAQKAGVRIFASDV